MMSSGKDASGPETERIADLLADRASSSCAALSDQAGLKVTARVDQDELIRANAVAGRTFGNQWAVVVSRGALEAIAPLRAPDQALDLLIAHEIGHVAARDIGPPIALIRGFIILMVLEAACVWAAISNASLLPLCAGIAIAFAAWAWATFFGAWRSRKREFSADRFAARLTGYGDRLGELLDALQRHEHPSPIKTSRLMRLMTGHPSISERVHRLSSPVS